MDKPLNDRGLPLNCSRCSKPARCYKDSLAYCRKCWVDLGYMQWYMQPAQAGGGSWTQAGMFGENVNIVIPAMIPDDTKPSGTAQQLVMSSAA